MIIYFMTASKSAIEIVKDFEPEDFNGRTVNDIIEGYKGTKKVSWRVYEKKPETGGEFDSNNLENLKEKRDKIIKLKKQQKINKTIAKIRLERLEEQIKELKTKHNITTVVCEIELYSDMVLVNQAGLRYNPKRYVVDIFSEGLNNGEFAQHGGKIILQIIFNLYNEKRDEFNFMSFIVLSVLSKNGEKKEHDCDIELHEANILKLLSFDSKIIFNL